jgi:hypothetical protein
LLALPVASAVCTRSSFADEAQKLLCSVYGAAFEDCIDIKISFETFVFFCKSEVSSLVEPQVSVGSATALHKQSIAIKEAMKAIVEMNKEVRHVPSKCTV